MPMPLHKFKANQSVELIPSDVRLKPLGRFVIVRPLPTEHGVLQYRIKSITDGHERVAIESELV
jgi:hypothetical protein